MEPREADILPFTEGQMARDDEIAFLRETYKGEPQSFESSRRSPLRVVQGVGDYTVTIRWCKREGGKLYFTRTIASRDPKLLPLITRAVRNADGKPVRRGSKEWNALVSNIVCAVLARNFCG